LKNNFSFNRTTKTDITTEQDSHFKPRKQESVLLLPVTLKDNNKDISIFSNCLEDHFLGGAVYRFLRCLTNIFLNERGLVLSKTEIDNISTEVLITINNFPRDDRILSSLPTILSDIIQQGNYQNRSSCGCHQKEDKRLEDGVSSEYPLVN